MKKSLNLKQKLSNKRILMFLIASFSFFTTILHAENKSHLIDSKDKDEILIKSWDDTVKTLIKPHWVHTDVKLTTRNNKEMVYGHGIYNEVKDNNGKKIAHIGLDVSGYYASIAEDKKYDVIIGEKDVRLKLDKNGSHTTAKKGKIIKNSIENGAELVINDNKNAFKKDVYIGKNVIRDTSDKKGQLIFGDESNKADGEKSIAIGLGNDVKGNNSIAIGNNNKIGNGENNFTLGNNTEIKNGVSNSVALGNNSTVEESDAVSVGKKGAERKIVNVKDGEVSETSKEAINGSQLKALELKGLQFSGNHGTNHTAPLGSTFNIKGSETLKETEANDKNVVTSINGNTLTIKIANKPKFDEVTAGKTVINNNGVSYGGNVYINENGINANNKKIINVANGESDTDAVNVSQIKGLEKNLSGGIATSVAMANIPQVGDNKLFSIGVGSSYYNKQGGFAVGISGTERSNTFIYKISAGIDTRKQWSIGAGFNINFVDNTKNVSYKNFNNNPLIDEISNLKNENKIVKEKLAKLEEKINQTNSLFKEKLYIIDQFVNNSYILTKLQLEKLKLIVKEINEKYSDRIIDITGYTDTNSSDKYNLALGLKRANKIS